MQFKITKETELSQHLTPEIATGFVAAPFFYQLLYHGIVRFYKEDGEKYSENEILTEGAIFTTHQPDLEGNDKSVYKVEKLTLTPELKSVKVKMIKASPKAAFTDSEMTVTYDARAEKPSVQILLECDALDETPIQLMKVMFSHAFKRIERLAVNPADALKDLRLISISDFTSSYAAHSYELPYSITTKFFIAESMENTKKAINSPSFLEKIFPDVVEKVTTNSDTIEEGDSCKVKIQNMAFENFRLGLLQEEVNFTVENSGNQLMLLSNKKVKNFHQLGYNILLESHDQNTTSITLGISYNKSNLISFASGAQAFSSLFTNKMPDPKLFLMLRARDILTSTIRCINHFFMAKFTAELIPESEKNTISKRKELGV